ncbi:hypothetical protein Pcinc_033830 [Petrolisthes cinctipes]|uniref:Uncharacterized protein n=1 Tax=Petrolisthes cinctipes TaxID=88211 RepID=A0AAE1ERH5_PETCI|nr:hypothetical protein Pcinc_033830 [Petrolisthes cinctipes]
MAIDQAHEQANAVITAEGASGVTEDPSALRRWMIAGPEVTHLVAQYEAACGTKEGIGVCLLFKVKSAEGNLSTVLQAIHILSEQRV